MNVVVFVIIVLDSSRVIKKKIGTFFFPFYWILSMVVIFFH